MNKSEVATVLRAMAVVATPFAFMLALMVPTEILGTSAAGLALTALVLLAEGAAIYRIRGHLR